MPRRSSRRRADEEDEEMDEELQEEEQEEEEEEEEEEDKKPRAKKMRNNNKRSAPVIADSEDDEGDAEDEDDEVTCLFHSQAPEMSQNILEVKDSDRNHLMDMSEAQREKAIGDLARLVLFKALAGESIDRLKACKEADVSGAKISSAAFDEVQIRLQNCFGFELKRMPTWMEKVKGIPKSMKDRYYVLNTVEDPSDTHSKMMHSVHTQSAIEKGLLMVVLGFVYCKGQPRNDGSRWISDKDLYDLLHRLDENLPPEPPSAGAKRNAKQHQSQSNVRRHGTPDVDALLQKFVQRDYLIKEKPGAAQAGEADEDSLFYTMGPRAVLEIGRRQVIFFCAEIMDEQVDDSNPMLIELDQNGDEDVDMTEE